MMQALTHIKQARNCIYFGIIDKKLGAQQVSQQLETFIKIYLPNLFCKLKMLNIFTCQTENRR